MEGKRGGAKGRKSERNWDGGAQIRLLLRDGMIRQGGGMEYKERKEERGKKEGDKTSLRV